jgi:hypothetical protein
LVEFSGHADSQGQTADYQAAAMIFIAYLHVNTDRQGKRSKRSPVVG